MRLRTAILFSLTMFVFTLQAQEAARHFTFRYSFTIKNVPLGKRLRIWIPLAHTDAYQQVHLLSVHSDLPVEKTLEPKQGNQLLYGHAAQARQADYQFTVDYDAVRYEHSAFSRRGFISSPKEKLSPQELSQGVQPYALVPVTGLPAELATQETKGRSNSLEKARAIYDYIFNTMRYEKTGTGWGKGDAIYACTAKKGNCTDFHSLFVSMARSQHIPARFEIGFPLPADRHSAEIPGYHCWADFYLPDVGWVPVDISEAWKHPEMREYFFGAHDANRIQFTVGRDLRLAPPQDGPPLNYFVFPYVEVDGKEYPDVMLAFSFRDAVPGSAAGR